ncbi:hypothetical protein [Komagataeibacter europaeus]|nr:hypothetical protein [Komagataeibacter europaeus]
MTPFACAHAADALGDHTATIAFTLSAADLGAGMSWGKGVLTFEGHDYPFRIRGGSGAAVMENNNGIHIKFTSRSSGARLAFSVERLTISLTPDAKAASAPVSATLAAATTPAVHE